MQDEPDGNARTFPPALEAKLVAAKDWYDQRHRLIDAQFSDAQAWSDSVAEGCLLLDEIIAMMDAAWGFGTKL